MVTVNNKNTKTTLLLFWYLHSLSWTVFTGYFCVSVVNFEQVIICWEGSHKYNLSKQDLFFHLIFQLLKFVLSYLAEDRTSMGGAWFQLSPSLLLNIEIDSELLVLSSKLHQSFMVKGKKYLKQSILQLYFGIWLFLVLMVCLL